MSHGEQDGTTEKGVYFCMNFLLDELSLGVTDGAGAARIVLRMTAALLLGAVLGYEREQTGKAAGLRTHMLVALGSALFVIASLDAGMATADVSRVLQGVAAGIGFIGAGAILKLTDPHQIKGLTTAASIWTTAAVGVTAGLGRFGVAILAAILAWITLSLLSRFESAGHPDR
jgi:putative Mg2+ transporter-C (MgtC) family protein